MKYETKQLNEETWLDFERLFAPNTGWGFCACMFIQRGRHLSGAEFSGREQMRVQNLAEKHALVKQSLSHGILVYDSSEPVGWCQYGPPEELPLPGTHRISRRIPPVSADVRWRITCFVTAVRHRRKGVATAALHAALSAIREQGGGLVEAYPAVPPIRSNYAHGGTISMFENAGFTIVTCPDVPYFVMQRVI